MVTRPQIINLCLEDIVDSHKEVEQYICDLEEQISGLRVTLGSVTVEAVEVLATAKNTAAVRVKRELGGYVKHYKLPRHVIINAKNKLEER
jgi:hypothetical protein|tara:strand:+ start:573 stop:845 length:273 start_codon:yes stop_codon:yes gene_type:complete